MSVYNQMSFSTNATRSCPLSSNKSTTGDLKRLVYINAGVLVHEYGLFNHTRRRWAASGIYSHTSKREYSFGRSTCRWYTANMHRARDANLCADMQICRDAYLVSVWLLHQLKYHLFGPRYSDTAEFRVSLLEWSWKCRIVAASLVLPFSMTEQSNHYFHWLMVSRRRPEKLRCINWWSAKVSLNLHFGQKPAARWWNFGGGEKCWR